MLRKMICGVALGALLTTGTVMGEGFQQAKSAPKKTNQDTPADPVPTQSDWSNLSYMSRCMITTLGKTDLPNKESLGAVVACFKNVDSSISHMTLRNNFPANLRDDSVATAVESLRVCLVNKSKNQGDVRYLVDNIPGNPSGLLGVLKTCILNHDKVALKLTKDEIKNLPSWNK